MKTFISLLKTTQLFLISNLRSPEALFFGFAFPLIFTAIFASIGQGPSSFEVGVYRDSVMEDVVFDAINESDILSLNTELSDDQINEQLNKGQLAGAILISQPNPPVDPNGVPQYDLQVRLSEASPQNAQIILNVIEQITSGINEGFAPQETKLVTLQDEYVAGRAYTQVDFVLPGQLSFALMSTAVFGISFSFITLRKTLVLKRMAATSAPRWLILSAKVLANVVLAALQAAVIIGVGYFFFEFTLINGWVTFLEMIALSVFGLLVFLSFGLLVASIARDENAASPIANIITLPQFILSGAFFPIEVLPEWLARIAQFLPMTYLNDALRTVSFEGGSLDTVLPEIAGLMVWAIIIYIPVVRLFRWE